MVKSSSPPSHLRRPPPFAPASSDERFKGVRRRSWGRWVSEIRIPHSRHKIWLGSYSSAAQAARAYDIATLLLRGPSCSTYLNFADSTALVSADHQLAALVAEGIASPRTIQATASAAANSVSVAEEAAACSSGDGSSHDLDNDNYPRSSHDLDNDNYPRSSDTSTTDCGSGQSHSTHLCIMVENQRTARGGVGNAMAAGSCWIQDVLTLIISPKDRTSPPSFSCSLQLSPSIARCSASASPLSTKTTSPDYQLLHNMLVDDPQYALEDLLRDGFTAKSAAVTTRKRFDTETVGPSCEVDSTQLWSYVR